MAKDKILPSLKSASGAGFTFDDKVAAFLLCEMLTGRGSLGSRFGVIEKLERQAVDWEPFGDLLLAVRNNAGKLVKCGSSVKSNRQINSNGCTPDLCSGVWATTGKAAYVRGEDLLALFCSTLSPDAHQHLHSLCNQAAECEPTRLDQKIVHAELRKIYDSFRNPKDKSEAGLPGHVLAYLVPREFDFEDNASRDEAEALRLCREGLSADTATDHSAADLWGDLLLIAQKLRTTGGEVTREKLATKLRFKFELRDDPSDTTEWSRIRNASDAWLNEIDTALPGGLTVPRSTELREVRASLVKGLALPVLGETGSGKSASVKIVAKQLAQEGAEVVWIKAEWFAELLKTIPNFLEVCQRTRKKTGLLVFDGLEGCYGPEAHKVIAQTTAKLISEPETPWRIILICQTPEWSRVVLSLTRHFRTSSILAQHFEFTELSEEDFDLVCTAHQSVARLSHQPHLRRVLAVPKMLDILLGGQLAENRLLASEADLVDWWWEQQVRGSDPIAAEERVARQLGVRMADELCTELPPDAVAGSESPTSTLIRNRVLRLTRESRVRFHHDLLADWSRVKHLLSLGGEAVAFMRAHAENPPWLRAIRLFSQYHLERIVDFEHWRVVVASCSTRSKEEKEPTAENLSVLDSWLEGIAYCTDVRQVLNRLQTDLFAEECWLFRRFISRLLHVGTVPDPVIQENFRRMEPGLVEAAGNLHRLPQPRLWSPVIKFLIENQTEATDCLPIELAEIATMWSRLEQYLKTSWSDLADTVLLSGEKELRREVAGKYRFDTGPVKLGGGHESRVKIYAAALRAASQFPHRAAKLLLKASGRAPWESGDVSSTTEVEWRGEWHERSDFGRWSVYIPEPPQSWPDGPRRRTSDDFFHAWFESGVAQILYNKLPDAACEATLAFLISWPKSELVTLREGYVHSGYEFRQRGFTFDAAHMYHAFWTTGPFLVFLRANWRPALDAIIRLVNYATDIHRDSCPHTEVSFCTPVGQTTWQGHPNVYAWHHLNIESAHVVTCALMALEKWLDEQVDDKRSVTDAVNLLYERSKSFASAGLLISIGKRHPNLFVSDLKPLLFVRDFYICDVHSTRNYIGAQQRPQDGKLVNNLRREWNRLPGRKTRLKDLCLQWLLTKPEFGLVFNEIVTAWRNEADGLPKDSEEQVVLLRWASDFDRSTWKEVTFADGQKGWTCERPTALKNDEEAQRIRRIQSLITLPQQCSSWLDQSQQFTDEQLEGIWRQLQDWEPFEQLGATEGEQEQDAMIRDHRNARAGLLAVLLCAGAFWLERFSERREWLENEVLKIIANPPMVLCFTPDEVYDDYESLLARAIVRCWSRSPREANWRGYVASFVTAHRYNTVRRLFQEAFKVRDELGSAYRELEAFALAFAAERKCATQFRWFRTRAKINASDLEKWGTKWLKNFAAANGPKWVSEWSKAEAAEPFRNNSPSRQKSSGREEVYRRDYGFDMGVILAAFGQFPSLTEARNDEEREHWFTVCKEMVALFCRTLPSEDIAASGNAVWHYDHWSSDEKIFEIVAQRLFECARAKQKELWGPIVSLPFAAHHHICSFLDELLIESLRVEPYRITELIPVWRDIAEKIFSSTENSERAYVHWVEIQKHVLLYGSIASAREEFWGPLVEELRPLYKQHIGLIAHDAYDQSSFAAFLISKAGEAILIDALVCLQPIWEDASDYFWKIIVERNNFANLLEHAWHNYFPVIRSSPSALKAFKALTLKLATHHIPIALEVQRQIGVS